MRHNQVLCWAFLGCVLLMVTGCGRGGGVELPESAIGADTIMLLHFDVGAADPERVGQGIDALYGAIPATDETRQVRLMLDGLRDTAKQRYRRFHQTAVDAGVRAIVFGVTDWEEQEVRTPSGHTYTHRVPGLFWLVQTEADTTPSDLLDAATRAFGESPPAGESPESLFSQIEAGWFAFTVDGLSAPTGGDADHAHLWGRYLADVGDAPLRVVNRMTERMVVDVSEGLAMLAAGLDDATLAAEGREALPHLDRSSYALHIGESPRLVARTWHTDAEAAERAERLANDLLSRMRSGTKLALAQMPGPAGPDPEVIDALFAHVEARRNGDRLEASLTLEAVHAVLEAFAGTPIFAELQAELADELSYMLGQRPASRPAPRAIPQPDSPQPRPPEPVSP